MGFFLVVLLGLAVWSFVLVKTNRVFDFMHYVATFGGPEIVRRLDRDEMVPGLRIFGAIGTALCGFLAVISGLALLA